MKVAILSLLLFSANFVVLGKVGLTTGQSCVFNFTLPYVRAANGEGPSVNVFFSGGASGRIWDSSIELFADSLSDPPFFKSEWGHTALPPNTSVGWAVSWISGTPPPWPDLQGMVRVTALTRTITLANLDKFSHIGVFSGGSIALTNITDMTGFKQKVKVVFVSYCSREVDPNNPGSGSGRGPFGGDPQANTEALKQAGVNSHYYVSPQTAHEWQSWRCSLYQFAPLLFQD